MRPQSGIQSRSREPARKRAGVSKFNAGDNANLALEQVNFSTRGQIILNLPKRIRDVLFRPYPWQLGNASQQLGAVGALIAIALLVLLAQAMLANRGQIMARAGPLVYTCAFLLVAYSLSAGNAGTGFRYRTHVVGIAICLIVTLRAARSSEPAAEPNHLEHPSGELVPSS